MNGRLIFLGLAGALFWVLAFDTGSSFFSYLAYLVTGSVALSFAWSRVCLDALAVRRFSRPAYSQIGQRVDEAFELVNRGRLPKVWLELRDFSTLPYHDSSRVISNLPRNGRRRWQVRTPCYRRGRYRLGPLTVRSSDPLGLFPREKHWPAASSLTVYPATVDLPHFAPAIADLAGDERVQQRTQIITTNAAGVREYVPGDSQNRIHWLSTARTGRLIAKEFELDPSAHVWIYLDLHREPAIALPWRIEPVHLPVFPPRGRTRPQTAESLIPPDTTEYAITVAASVFRHFILRGRAVGFAAYGQTREFIPVERGERQLNKALEALAVLDAEGQLPLADFILTDGFRLSRNETLIVITADRNVAWVQALRTLREKGILSLAIVIDGQTFDAGVDGRAVLAELRALRIPHYRVAREQKLDEALAQPLAAAGAQDRGAAARAPLA